jgi:hypothetical protein
VGHRPGCRNWTIVRHNDDSPSYYYWTGIGGRLMAYDPNQTLQPSLTETAPDGRLLWTEDGDGNPTDYAYSGTSAQLLTVQ